MGKDNNLKSVKAKLTYENKIKHIKTLAGEELFNYVAELIEYVPIYIIINTLRYRKVPEETIKELLKIPKLGLSIINKISYVYLIHPEVINDTKY